MCYIGDTTVGYGVMVLFCQVILVNMAQFAVQVTTSHSMCVLYVHCTHYLSACSLFVRVCYSRGYQWDVVLRYCLLGVYVSTWVGTWGLYVCTLYVCLLSVFQFSTDSLIIRHGAVWHIEYWGWSSVYAYVHNFQHSPMLIVIQCWTIILVVCYVPALILLLYCFVGET